MVENITFQFSAKKLNHKDNLHYKGQQPKLLYKTMKPEN